MNNIIIIGKLNTMQSFNKVIYTLGMLKTKGVKFQSLCEYGVTSFVE